MYTESLLFKNFSIIGHSMGAHVVRMFTALYPEMVNALVLLYAYGFLLTDLTEIPKVMRQGMDEMLQFEQKREQINRVYTYETAVERLLAANSSLSERSVHILLERGLVEVEGEVAIEFLTGLLNKILESERMPEEWRRSVLVPIFKNKGDVQSCGNCKAEIQAISCLLCVFVVKAF
ncbi:serine hydrolase-like protein [Mastacembelus armatus]|uniref:serine hydrolase-like protein n=1 Tax=Mastacembelus armatus TaxID=205130 RepID=UPI000E45D876|nr:serine hydrolase-like protein [Mastacembelus armatus]